MRASGVTAWLEAAALPWLVDVSMQASLVLGAALLAGWRAGPRLSAAKRHAMLAAGLFGVPLLMVASPWVPGWGWAAVAEAGSGEAVSVRSAAEVAESSPAGRLAEERGPVEGRAAPNPGDFSGSSGHPGTLLMAVWAAGLGVCGLIVLPAAWRLRRLRLASTPLRGGRRFELLQSLRAEMGIAGSRRLSLVVSGAQSMPMTWGWRHPVILLPAESGDWHEARLRLVLRHELAHVARADSAVSLAGFLCAGLLWFHPLGWLCCHRLWRLREHACDDHVLTASGADPVGYAGELVATIRALGPARRPVRFPALAVAMGMARPGAGGLGGRVRALLDEDRQRAGFGGTARRVALPCWLLAVVVLAGLSACRERTADGNATPAGPDRRVFVLSDEQWLRLTGGDERFRPEILDPFAPVSAKAPGAAALSTADLDAAALVIRSHLIGEGVGFHFGTAEEAAGAVTLGDARTLVVTGDQAVLGQVAELLRGYADEPQIRIRAHVFRVPADFDYRGLLEIVAGQESGDGVAGIVDGETAQALLERVGSIEGGEVIAHPVVVTGSGRNATIAVGREFIYPTEYEPPELAGREPGEPAPESGVFQVTPASPAAFETRHVGLELSFEPALHADGRMDLELELSEVAFGGFVNYGSPIRAAVKNPQTGGTDSIVLTENRIEMPVFTRSNYASKITVDPGDWVVIGGIGNSDDQSIETITYDPDSGERRSVVAEERVRTMLFFVIQAAVTE